MLQQTRVAAMLPLYNQFLLRFPDLESLAKATEDEVLESWRGLGYYSRARNLRKASAYILSRYNGRFPENLEEALDIPGVGPYTARAVLSIAYGKKYAVLDGNVKRVISRFYAESEEKKFQVLADQFLNREKAGDHNQAMMELGALVCLSSNPQCKTCPLNQDCKAYLQNKISDYPPRKKKTDPFEIQMEFILLEFNEKFLLMKDPYRRFYKTIFSLPYRILIPERSGISDLREIGKNPIPEIYSTPRYLESILADRQKIMIPGSAEHSITHHKIEIHLVKIKLDPGNTLDQSIIQSKEEGDGVVIPKFVQTKWTDWDRLEMDFPSSTAKKIKKFPGVEGLFPR
jgi:A/G-specific adenine glycosylase